uniref:WH2 domain-containing protein n=1 Tax=Clastoptera arizonana TaxID=38151 RepID=A0A1B6CSA5_9HEMI
MPAVNSNPNQSGSGPPPRTTFRPPWVKEGPNPLPMPSAPWTASRNRDANAAAEVAPKSEKPVLRKQSKISIIPSQPPVVDSDKQEPQQSRAMEIKTESKRVEPKEKEKPSQHVQPLKKPVNTEKVVPIKIQRESDPPVKTKQLEKMNSFSKSESKSHLPPRPPAPPLPPPPPPQPPKHLPPPDFNKKPITAEKAAKLDSLRSRPRRRPDWTDMMKEVERGQKLKHVQCNDRSAPVLPESKAKGQFVYESEKDNAHNQLLKQIQKGVCLKKTRTNDRSKPILDGLRKFRRQMTIEEQIQKSASVADVVAVAAEPDELDDIDKVRDDLQSTKQMLALELRNKEALERENKRLLARLLNLEVELEKEKASSKVQAGKGEVIRERTEEDEKLVQQLKAEVAEANQVGKEMENQYRKTAEELDATRAKLETAWLRNQHLEQELKQAQHGANLPVMKQPSSKRLAPSMSNGRMLEESDDEPESIEVTESESESEDDTQDAAAQQERRNQRELKLLNTKVKSYSEKLASAKKERINLKQMLKKQQNTLKDEKKKYKILQKEVDKMAKLMKDVDEEDEEEEEEEDEEEEESETESDSDSDESGSEEESDEDRPDDDADIEEKKEYLTGQAKSYENRLASMKKGNYLLKANIDRAQDDINRQREMSLSLQEDLNSVLAELG